ncbi:MAG TPA: glycine-rich protein, partial [Bacteroidia bacterium]|nr:glycine-rich protein [Bacteroidia bacterium]
MKKLITTSFIIALSIVGVSAQTDTLFYTGALQTITVPPCVTSITVDMAGGQGGNISNLTAAPHTATGGLGGRVTATIPVVGGAVLQVNVGGKGLSDSATLSCIVATGGFNGGGIGYGGYNSYNYNAGGGGGATDIRVSPYGFANVLAVAGGGGGAGCTGCTGGGVNGGLGGGLTGGNGFGGACASGT